MRQNRWRYRVGMPYHISGNGDNLFIRGGRRQESGNNPVERIRILLAQPLYNLTRVSSSLSTGFLQGMQYLLPSLAEIDNFLPVINWNCLLHQTPRNHAWFLLLKTANWLARNYRVASWELVNYKGRWSHRASRTGNKGTPPFATKAEPQRCAFHSAGGNLSSTL